VQFQCNASYINYVTTSGTPIFTADSATIRPIVAESAVNTQTVANYHILQAQIALRVKLKKDIR